jgi:hypothetical protein
MANPKTAQTITVGKFQRTGQFSGEVRVIGGSRARRGVPGTHRRASCKSSVSAGTDAASCANVGGNAHTSAAHATNLATDADLAKTKAKELDSRRGAHAPHRTNFCSSRQPPWNTSQPRSNGRAASPA